MKLIGVIGWTLFVAGLALHWPARARAYGCESLLTDSCHEKMTMAAMRLVRQQVDTAPPLPAVDKVDRALIDEELPFKVDDDLQELGTVALLLGNRWIDFKGLLSRDTDELAYIHGDPEGQKEHFCRQEQHDEDNDGARRAIDDSYRYVQAMAFRAIAAGLDAQGRPDGDKRTVVPTFLNYSGTVNVRAPIFYLYMGQATHTLQDSFSHALRTPDGMKITSPLNAVELATGDYDERRDGPPHMSALDQCEDLDPRRERLKLLAVRSTVALLVAALKPGQTEAQRKAAVTSVLDTYLGYQPGCTYDNRWCDAPENAYRDPKGCSCRTASGGLAQGWPAALVLLLLVAARWRRRLAGLLALALLALCPATAGAQATSQPGAPACVAGRQLRCACPDEESGVQVCADDGAKFGPCVCPGSGGGGGGGADGGKVEIVKQAQAAEVRSVWGAEMTLGAALDKTAFAISGAVRLRLHEKWLVGLGLEWNPWASLDVMKVNEGAFNAYFTGIRRYPVTERVAMRSTAHFGTSVLLLNLVGAPAGSVGLYFRLSLIGLEWRVSRLFTLVIDPADVTLPVPHLTGTPLSYIQYRFSVGLQI